MSIQEAPWYKTSFRRSLTDMHIPDWDEQFLSQFDSQNYVNMLELAHVDAAMIYTISCLGISNWPTQVGHMHEGLKGRDIIGEIINGCNEKGIKVIVYYNFWSKWAYNEHPEWRIIAEDGKGTAEYLWDEGRYGVCCFNTGYREFMYAQIEELCDRYDFAGFWMDMIFWPYTPCYCGGCRKRYHEEVGGDIPRVVDWTDPKWVHFQRKREEWLAEFIGSITAKVKDRRPNATVGHQYSAWSVGWKAGMTLDAFKHSDYASGDFYGDALLQSFTCKAFHYLTENKPFEFMTSRCPDLTDHTTGKSKELLRAQLYGAISNQGIFFLIDAIDPIGTLDRSVYELMGEIYHEAEGYEKYINHDAIFCQDVAIYINFEPEVDAQQGEEALMKRAMNTAKSLMEENITYGVITKKNLAELSRFQAVILPNIKLMDEEEVAAFKSYVHNGGSLYASKHTSLYNKMGIMQADFQLADVFGVSYEGVTDEKITYMAPLTDGCEELGTYSQKYPATLPGSQLLVNPSGTGNTLATITLPYVNPKIIGKFSSAISNPPGKPTSWPSIHRNQYGQGQAIYVAGELESIQHEGQRAIFKRLIHSLCTDSFYIESNAPKSVEITLFYDQEAQRYLINLLNFQHELPNIPVDGITVRVKLDGKKPKQLYLAPEEKQLEYTVTEDYLSFKAPVLETFHMFILEF